MIMLILNAFNMQNAYEHFPVEGFKNAFTYSVGPRYFEKSQCMERGNAVKGAILDLLCYFTV